MKKLTFTLVVLALGLFVFLALAVSSAFAQTMLTMTTLSSAVSNGTAQTIIVGSATGISAPAPNTGNVYGTATSEAQSYLYVDRELMEVKGVSSTTISVIRGVAGTFAVPHASSALVFVIPSNFIYGGGLGGYPQGGSAPQGSCTRANEIYLPRINFASGVISDCLGGQWVNGDAMQTQRQSYNGWRFPDPGGTAYTGLETSGTAAGAATEIYCTEIDLPYSKYITGLGVLLGTTTNNNNLFLILYDSGGKVLANTATAGTSSGASASIYKKVNFVTPYYAVGPARYFGCVGLDGTSDTIRHAVTSTNDYVLGGTITSQTFGTAAAITVPTSFTTAKVPYLLVY